LILAIVSVVLGYKKGFIESVLGFVRSILTLTMATYLSPILAEFIYNGFIKEKVNSQISENLSNIKHLGPENFLNNFPNQLSQLFPYLGVNKKLNLLLNSNRSEEMDNAICELLSPAYIYIIKAVLFVIFSIIFYALFGIIRRTTRKIFAIPVLSQINSACGAILGFLEYTILIILILMAIRLVLPIMKNTPEIFSDNIINKTLIFKEIYYHNPIYEIFNVVFSKIY
jgi:hypothetical protein